MEFIFDARREWERQGMASLPSPFFAFPCSISQREPLAALHAALQKHFPLGQSIASGGRNFPQ